MDSYSYSGKDLEKALEEGTLTQNKTVIRGMVKPSEKSGHISFTASGCNSWIDLPVDMIDDAVPEGNQPCRDHSHPVMRITLKEPEDDQGQMLASLMAQTGNHISNLPNSDPFAPTPSLLIYCSWRCVEWSWQFPGLCNRWALDCAGGPIIIIYIPWDKITSPGIAIK